jgi:Flp pilus assembly protein TadG
MRERRGNYMLMFAFLLPIMLAFLAFSIDLGRMRVARVQASNAADAAAVAALATMRDGGSRGLAQLAAQSAANRNYLGDAMTGGDGSSSAQWQVEVDWGDWDWDTRNYASSSGATAACTVNVTQQGTGVAMLFAPIFEITGWFEGGAYSGGNGVRRAVRMGKRAALRPRDIVIAVDVSRGALQEDLSDTKAMLGELLDALDDLQVEGDRVGVVIYAGSAMQLEAIQELGINFPDLRDTLTEVEPCAVKDDAWFYFYRHYDFSNLPFGDPELDGQDGFNYQVVDHDGAATGGPSYKPVAEGFELLVQAAFPPDEAAAFLDPTTEKSPLDQCNLWDGSLLLFESLDPRRARQNASLVDSPLSCHSGHFLENDPNRFDANPEHYIWPLDCAAVGGLNAALKDTPDPDFPGQQLPRYGGPVLEGAGVELQPDWSYSIAGSNPASALSLAEAMFVGAGDTNRERQLILVAGSGIKCGDYMRPSAKDNCEDEWEANAFLASESLDELGVDTHVLAVVDDFTPEDVFLSNLVTGRGLYRTASEPDDLEGFAIEVARNARVQVVE